MPQHIVANPGYQYRPKVQEFIPVYHECSLTQAILGLCKQQIF